MSLVFSYDFAIGYCLLPEDVAQVSVPAVRHDGFVDERIFHLLVDV